MNNRRDLWFSGPNTGKPTPPVPVVYVRDEATVVYKVLERDLNTEAAPTEDELNALGAEGWQIAGMITVGDQLLFYLQKLAG